MFFKDNIPPLKAYTVIHSKKILYSLLDIRRKEQRGVDFSFLILWIGVIGLAMEVEKMKTISC